MKNIVRGAFAAAAIAAALPAAAADLPAKGPAMAPAPTYMEAFDPFMIRIRGIAVIPDSGKGGISQAVTGRAALLNGQVKAKEAYMPEVDVTYFFTKNIAVEAICCVSVHNIKGSLPNGTGLGTIGRTWVFPPTVMLQYHFTDFGAFKPYVGVGVNYTHFFDTKAKGALAAAPFLGDLKLKDTWGVAGQVGFDYMLNRNWGINVDVKRILMEPKFSSYNTTTGTLNAAGKAKINPWIIGVGVTYRFGGPSAVVAKY